MDCVVHDGNEHSMREVVGTGRSRLLLLYMRFVMLRSPGAQQLSEPCNTICGVHVTAAPTVHGVQDGGVNS